MTNKREKRRKTKRGRGGEETSVRRWGSSQVWRSQAVPTLHKIDVLSLSLTHSLTVYPAEKAHTRAASRAHWEVDYMKKLHIPIKQTRNHTYGTQKTICLLERKMGK
jgi:hypothetical protein